MDLGPTGMARIEPREDLAGRRLGELSGPFGPFLDHFVQETWRAGGEVLASPERGPAEALLISDPSGPVGTVFARTPGPARSLASRRARLPLYSEVELDGSATPFDLFGIRLATAEPTPSIRHVVELAGPDEQVEVFRLWRSVLGPIEERWFHGLPSGSERTFLARVGGRAVGAAGLQLVGGHARLHSVVVAPGFRSLGIGTDLVRARLWWAARSGAVDAIAEIARTNVASRSAAERAGLRPVGEMYFYDRAAPGSP